MDVLLFASGTLEASEKISEITDSDLNLNCATDLIPLHPMLLKERLMQ
jgi:hypothetical protein